MNAHPQRGMSIVELMVAIVIAMVGILVIFQVFANSEAIRRSTTGGADQQTNGLIALLQLEREIKAAGYMINDPTLLGCTMKTYDTERDPAQVPEFPLAPIEIISNNGTASDVIRAMYGHPNKSAVGIPLELSMEKPDDNVVLKGRFGIRTGDVLLLGQPPDPATATPKCTLIQATGIPAGVLDIEHANGEYYNEVKKEVRPSRFNDPGGTPELYQGKQAKALNLGQDPVYSEMWVRNDSADPKDNHQLVYQNLWAQVASPIPVADHIVQFKAEYGMDDGVSNGSVPPRVFKADDDVVDKYTPDRPKLTDVVAWGRVRTVRLAVVSRSLTPEKPISGTACDATPDWGSAGYPVVWARDPGTPAGRPIDVRTTVDWRCYKYHVYETVVPLRNVLWRQ
jgi:type IV pilus assembly protein PilW